MKEQFGVGFIPYEPGDTVRLKTGERTFTITEIKMSQFIGSREISFEVELDECPDKPYLGGRFWVSADLIKERIVKSKSISEKNEPEDKCFTEGELRKEFEKSIEKPLREWINDDDIHSFYMGVIQEYAEAYAAAKTEDPGLENYKTLTAVARDCAEVVFAWGNFKVVTDTNTDVMLRNMFPDAKALHINKNGSPKHPLYCRANTQLVKFDTKTAK